MCEKLIGTLSGLQVPISGQLSGPITIFVKQRLQGASRKMLANEQQREKIVQDSDDGVLDH